jgi:hypothetical protein
MTGDFAQLASENRLGAAIYYSWTGDPSFDLDRCGGPGEAARTLLKQR